jgi:hypothetical protein
MTNAMMGVLRFGVMTRMSRECEQIAVTPNPGCQPVTPMMK